MAIIRNHTSWLGLFLSMAALCFYVTIMIYILSSWRMTPQRDWVQARLKGYGHFFIVAQCNMYFQLFNLTLHIFGHFYPAYRLMRDRVFSLAALPLSVSTTISFWILWYCLGRYRIWPEDETTMYPVWIVHGLHTFSPCVNLLLQRLMVHEFTGNPLHFTIVFIYVNLYGAGLMYVYTGSLHHAFIKKFTSLETSLYYIGFTVLSHVCYWLAVWYERHFDLVAEYRMIQNERETRAEHEANAHLAPTPPPSPPPPPPAPPARSRSPSPVQMAPVFAPTIDVPTTDEEQTDEDSSSIATSYVPQRAAPAPPERHSEAGPSAGSSRTDRKND